MKIIEGKDGQMQFDISEERCMWEELKIWVKAMKEERKLAGDAYRFTAYEAVEKKMDELDRG